MYIQTTAVWSNYKTFQTGSFFQEDDSDKQLAVELFVPNFFLPFDAAVDTILHFEAKYH